MYKLLTPLSATSQTISHPPEKREMKDGVFLEPQLNCEGCFSSEVVITLEGNITEIVTEIKKVQKQKIKNIKNVCIANQEVYI